ncbi:hypothetical protein K461DRAFT_293137 [Myriangium duriaei CBS 260.36]|uniref:Uncharacterized protein n=1 Tax=Myriangium duriaei CBS 260.36 TaxID=1168546 RepID=A0A9P4MPA0_9PEZI|nr:hypothetical protein K461DRAFT_293137 [Myriangium duriaei CBS 260.36]
MFVPRVIFHAWIISASAVANRVRYDAFYNDAQGELKVLKASGEIHPGLMYHVAEKMPLWSGGRYKAAVYKDTVLAVWNVGIFPTHGVATSMLIEMQAIIGQHIVAPDERLEILCYNDETAYGMIWEQVHDSIKLFENP